MEICSEHLLAERIVRPPVDTLVRMVAAARERAHVTTHELLSAQLQGGRPRELDRLLVLHELGGVTRVMPDHDVLAVAELGGDPQRSVGAAGGLVDVGDLTGQPDPP